MRLSLILTVTSFFVAVLKLQKWLERRESETEGEKKRALVCKKAGNLAKAKIHLARYKQLDAALDKQRGALVNVEHCLDKLHEMQWNVSVVEGEEQGQFRMLLKSIFWCL